MFIQVVILLFFITTLLFFGVWLSRRLNAGKPVIALVMVVLLILLGNQWVTENLDVTLKKVNLYSDKLSRPLKILQITDFHSDGMVIAERLIAAFKQDKPDVVVLTGDNWQQTKSNSHRAMNFLAKYLVKNFPTYAVAGNHDNQIIDADNLCEVTINSAGQIDFIERPNGILLRNEVFLTGVGIDTPVSDFDLDDKYLNICLSHYPDTGERLLVRNNNLNLVLSGHTHGGQIRLPLIGAIVGYDHGFFPELRNRDLMSGLIEVAPPKRYRAVNNLLDGGQKIYICSGSGYNWLPIRIGCPRQISLIVISPLR